MQLTQQRYDATVRALAIGIWTQAAKSALDLGNYPLGTVDLRCAFDMAMQDRAKYVMPQMLVDVERHLVNLLGRPF